ncbi:OmpP1/FadL family transporter [Sphingomonas jatrophae]|uniref:Long-chain fatty acid transport protein n=1 Tax=Sphingomonas jatrophae TaxID=1166337 RepID=A0A1I6JF81_9SPHN|nr:outer membrane protein transport protein [Sphingomonas jatrophae]SFR77627.1 long-chain fatty acid transport protein [Sphingomonas jatrophae]
MTLRSKSLLFAAAFGGLVATSGVANANAFYLQAQNARGAGRAFSGEAADTGAASLWWNPAAIGGMTTGEATLGATGIIPRGRVVDTGTTIRRPTNTGFVPVGGDGIARNPINKGVLPSGAVAYPLTDRIAIGVSVTSPFSFTTNYDDDSWTRYSADRTKLRTIDIQPSLGVAVTDWLRLGGAVNIEYSDASLSNALPNVAATLPDGEQRLKGDGWDFGYSVGGQIHSGDQFTFGVSYKSSIKHKLKGDVTISGLLGPLAAQNRVVDATATFRTPWQLIFSGRGKVSDQLTLNAQVIRFGWNKFDAIRLGAPLNTAIPEDYRNTWSYAGGLDYQLHPKITLRAGVQHALTPTRDGNRDARVPDANRWIYAAGSSYQMTPNFALDFGVNYADFKNETIDRVTAAYAGTAAQTPILTSGVLRKASAWEIAVGGRLTF